jgi:hypothetical protein
VLANWLIYQNRQPCPYGKFALNEITEQRSIDINNPDDTSVIYLGQLLLQAHGNPQMIADDLEMLLHDASTVGLNIVREYIENRVLPRRSATSTRIGNLGEILAAQCMVELAGYTFPIYKLRYREKRNWAMRLTDFFMVKKQPNNRLLVCYGEVKTRSGSRYNNSVKMVGVEAHDSLTKDDALENPEILTFIRQQLYAQNRFDEARLFGRIQNKKIEYDTNFVLFLVHNTAIWNEEILVELNNHEIDERLSNLSVNVLYISDLRNVIDVAYENAWKGVIDANG